MLQEPIVSSPAPAFPTNLRYIQNGDALNTGNHQLQATDVAQALGHLEGTKLDQTDTHPIVFSDLTMSGTTRVKLASRSITRVEHSPFYSEDLAVWGLNPIGEMQQLSATVSSRVAGCPLRVPHGVTLTAVSVRVAPANHTGLPAVKPRMYLRRPNTSSGAVVELGDVTDPSADITAYNAAHEITLSGLSEAIDRTANRYVVNLVGESGTDSMANMLVIRASYTYTTTFYDED